MAIFNTIYMGNTQKEAWQSPAMTGNNTPSPLVASANSEYVSSDGTITYYAYRAFDKNENTSWYSSKQNSWIQLDFGKQTRVTGVRLLPDSVNFQPSYFPKQITISGSYDGETWTEIVVDNGENYSTSFGWRIINFGVTTSYRYYKFNFGPAYNGQTQSIVSEIEFYKEVTA